MYKKRDKNVYHGLRDSFRELSAFLQTKNSFEKGANQHNFESGLPLEEYFRQKLGRFIPSKFAVDSGKIVDREGYTCGDCDFVIYESNFAPLVKLPATPYSRRKYIPFESTYGIIEIKQNLTLSKIDNRQEIKNKGTLFQACEKIFAYKELEREKVDVSKIIHPTLNFDKSFRFKGEREQYNNPIGLIFFYDTELDVEKENDRHSLMMEFYNAHKNAPKNLWVNGVFVLNKFSLHWTILNNEHPELTQIVDHPSDAQNVLISTVMTKNDTLYSMYIYLWKLLITTHLSPPNFLRDYGGNQIPKNLTYSYPWFDEDFSVPNTSP